MESWRLVWRDGFVPVMSSAALESLRDGLAADTDQLTQGSTTTPPPLMCVQDWPCEAADALGYAGWKGENLETVGEVEEYFARACFEADQRLGEPAACRWFLNWWDDTRRGEARRELHAECVRALRERPVANPDGPAFGPDSPGAQANHYGRSVRSAPILAAVAADLF